MKRLYLVFAMTLLVHFLAFGQSLLEQGTFSINGNISFTSYYEKNSENNSTVFIFNPSFDYFLIDNLSIGLTLNFRNTSLGEYSNSNWGIGPSLRYYFNAGKSIKPFTGVGYSYATENATYSMEDFKYNNIILNAGVDYFLTDNVALETIISYTFINLKLPNDYRTYYQELDVTRKSLSVGLGVNIFLR